MYSGDLSQADNRIDSRFTQKRTDLIITQKEMIYKLFYCGVYGPVRKINIAAYLSKPSKPRRTKQIHV